MAPKYRKFLRHQQTWLTPGLSRKLRDVLEAGRKIDLHFPFGLKKGWETRWAPYVIHLPGTFTDLLTEVLRNGAHALLVQAGETEAAIFFENYTGLKTEDGRQRLVRHGHLPEREVMTGIGAVQVRQPRLRDRGADGERIKFTPSILPPYARRSKSLEVLLPILYLKGLSTGDFGEALTALLGKDAPGVSASTIARLKAAWADEHTSWEKRDLSAKRYVYVWADGIHLQARLEDDAQCILVLLGATPEGTKEIDWFHRWLSRKRTILAWVGAQAEAARAAACSRARHRGWRARLLESARRGLANHA
jgi:hypothetical protein